MVVEVLVTVQVLHQVVLVVCMVLEAVAVQEVIGSLQGKAFQQEHVLS